LPVNASHWVSFPISACLSTFLVKLDQNWGDDIQLNRGYTSFDGS
jgi:hypothetical protein